MKDTKELLFKIVKLQKAKKPITSETYEHNIGTMNNNEFNDGDEQSGDLGKINPNSLISISREVYKYLEETKYTKGNDVTQLILDKLNVSQDDMSFKNIQRRVYDAINVMYAIGILNKDKNTLEFKGHKSFKQMFSKKSINRNKALKDRLNYKAERINTKQHELMVLVLKVLVDI
jgi:hypothetical protein